MVFFPAFDTLYCLPLVLTFVFWWLSYFSSHRSATSALTHKKSLIRVRPRTLSLTTPPSSLFETFNFPNYCLSLVWFLTRGIEDTYLMGHFFLSNTTFTFFFFLSVSTTALWSWLVRVEGSLGLASANFDYVLALVHLLAYTPLIVLTSSLLGFFFILELSSVLLILSFTALQNLNKKKTENKKIVEPDAGFNLIFFHFWSSFFSSLLILYSILNFFFLFGTTEWACLNLFTHFQLMYAQQQLLVFLTLTLLLSGLLIKLGIGPFFAYKLEIYQGLPLYALVFYSILYFGIFMSVTLFLFGYYLPFLLNALQPVVMLGVIVFFVLFGFLLFDSLLLRQFFALSSLITSVNLLTLLI